MVEWTRVFHHGELVVVPGSKQFITGDAVGASGSSSRSPETLLQRWINMGSKAFSKIINNNK
jgi:hypothetical protein